MRWGMKTLLWGGAGVVVLAVLGLTLLLSAWKTVAKDQVLVRAVSPDRAHVAELRQILASMHGGPDHIEVTLDGSVVYSKVFECNSAASFGLAWEDSQRLKVRFGRCLPSDSPQVDPIKANRDLYRVDASQAVQIDYVSSDQTDTR